jgi:hypothetical protein
MALASISRFSRKVIDRIPFRISPQSFEYSVEFDRDETLQRMDKKEQKYRASTLCTLLEY